MELNASVSRMADNSLNNEDVEMDSYEDHKTLLGTSSKVSDTREGSKHRNHIKST
jgi:hypothetical protein